MIISAIVAKARNNVIGLNGQIPWYLPADLKYFKKTTLNHHIIMGRKTYESIGRPLPKRTNIVLSRDPFFMSTGIVVAHNLEEALEIGFENGANEVFIIGGGGIYHQALSMCSRLYVTEVACDPQGDVFFPTLNSDSWSEIFQEAHKADEKNAFDYTFKVLERKHLK